MNSRLTEDANLLSRLNRMPITRSVVGIIIIVTLIGLCEAFDIGIVGSIITVLKKPWHLNAAKLGLLGISSTVGVVVGLIPSGFLADRFGRRRVVILGVIFFSVITFLGAFVGNFSELLLIRFFAGIGEGAILPMPYLILSEFIRSKRRGVTVGYTNGIQTAAYLLPNLVGLWAISRFSSDVSWRVLFGIGIIPMLLLIPIYLWLPESPRYLLKKNKQENVRQFVEKLEDQAKLPHDSSIVDPRVLEVLAKGVVKQRSFSRLVRPPYLSRGLVTASQYLGGLILFYIMLVFGPSIMISKGFGSGNALLFISIMMGLAGFGSVAQGYLSDYWGRKRILSVYFMLAAIGCLLMAFFSGYVLLAAGFLTAFFGLGVYPVSKMYIAEQYPTKIRGEGVYLNEMTGRLLAGVVTTYFIPAILNAWGNAVIFEGIAILLVLLTVPMMIWGRETAGISIEEAGTDVSLAEGGFANDLQEDVILPVQGV